MLRRQSNSSRTVRDSSSLERYSPIVLYTRLCNVECFFVLDSCQQHYRTDEASCTFGTVSAKGEYRAKSNFFMELDTYVDGESAGYFVWVQRKSDGQKRYASLTVAI